MAKACSFDVVSEVDMQEVDNAVNQAKKEIGTRFDFRGSKCEISLTGETITIHADDDYKLTSVIDILTPLTRRLPIPLVSVSHIPRLNTVNLWLR